eukprot:scaffold52877_cov41-Phaeocystis_antarctica.AAC.2
MHHAHRSAPRAAQRTAPHRAAPRRAPPPRAAAASSASPAAKPWAWRRPPCGVASVCAAAMRAHSATRAGLTRRCPHCAPPLCAPQVLDHQLADDRALSQRHGRNDHDAHAPPRLQ